MEKHELIQTGISGLDGIFLGGVTKGNVILVEGGPGTGKSLLGMSFLYYGITEYNEPGIMVIFEASPHKVVRDAAAFGWDLERWQEENKLKIIFTSPQVFAQQLRATDSLLLETAAQMGAKRIFIDGISLLRSVATGKPAKGAGTFREVLQQLLQGLQRENLTAILSHEVAAREDQASLMEIAEFLADTVIFLKQEPFGAGVRRSLEITKSRGQDYEYGKHTLQITSKGVQVYRRVQARPRGLPEQPTFTTKRSLVGDPIDLLIGGGIFDGSTTLVAGVSGVGKTVLGVQLLLEGAVKHGKKGLLVSLDEHPAQILRNATTLGLNLKDEIDAGKVHVYYESPQELEIDVHYARIIETIEKHKIERLLIDGMTSYSSAVREQRLFRDFFHGLVNYGKHHGLACFFNYENPELFGITHFMPDFAVSSIVDNIILMNFVELGSSLRRAITVAKARGSEHHFVTREFTIGKGGITLLPEDASLALPVFSFQRYYALLSRAPTRFTEDMRKDAPG